MPRHSMYRSRSTATTCSPDRFMPGVAATEADGEGVHVTEYNFNIYNFNDGRLSLYV